MAFISVFPGFTAEEGFGLTGNIGDGNSVTITGSGFGTKPNGVGPWLWWDFGSGSTSNGAGSRGTFTENWTTNAALLQNTVAPNRTHSVEMDLASIVGSMHTGLIELATSNTDMYMFERSYLNSDGLDMFAFNTIYNLKEHRYAALSANGFNNIFSPNEQGTNEVEGGPRLGAENVGGDSGSHFFTAAGGFKAVFGLRKNEWKTDEWQFHQGDVDVSEGTIKMMRNGVVHTHSPNGGATFVTRTTANNTLMFRFAYMQSAKISGGKVFSDILYLDDSFYYIIISDEPTWEAATASPEVFYEREIQIPTAWADGEVTFTMRRGVHSSFAGKYAYIVSNGIAQKAVQFN